MKMKDQGFEEGYRGINQFKIQNSLRQGLRQQNSK